MVLKKDQFLAFRDASMDEKAVVPEKGADKITKKPAKAEKKKGKTNVSKSGVDGEALTRTAAG